MRRLKRLRKPLYRLAFAVTVEVLTIGDHIEKRLNTWPFVNRRRVPSVHYVGDQRDSLRMAKQLHGYSAAITILSSLLVFRNAEITMLFVMLAAATGLVMRLVRMRNAQTG